MFCPRSNTWTPKNGLGLLTTARSSRRCGKASAVNFAAPLDNGHRLPALRVIAGRIPALWFLTRVVEHRYRNARRVGADRGFPFGTAGNDLGGSVTVGDLQLPHEQAARHRYFGRAESRDSRVPAISQNHAPGIVAALHRASRHGRRTAGADDNRSNPLKEIRADLLTIQLTFVQATCRRVDGRRHNICTQGEGRRR